MIQPYNLILVDPPWKYSHSKSKSRRVENKYPTLTLDRLKEMDISELCDPVNGTVMACWATGPKLKQAHEWIDAVGFEYKTFDPWQKHKKGGRKGMGYYTRLRHEIILFAQWRKKPYACPLPKNRPDSGLYGGWRPIHSAKPLSQYPRLERMWPDARRIELFSREPMPGWDAWGLDAVNAIDWDPWKIKCPSEI